MRALQLIWLTVSSIHFCRPLLKLARKRDSVNFALHLTLLEEIHAQGCQNTLKSLTNAGHVSMINPYINFPESQTLQMNFEVLAPARMNVYSWSAIRTRESPSLAPAMAELNMRVSSVLSHRVYLKKVSKQVDIAVIEDMLYFALNSQSTIRWFTKIIQHNSIYTVNLWLVHIFHT